MPQKQMQELLAELRREVAGAETLSEAQRQRMEELQEEIERRMAEEPPRREGSPADMVRAQIDEFQREHPTLTMVLGRILDSLNKMGI
jgi:hypothetical protein